MTTIRAMVLAAFWFLIDVCKTCWSDTSPTPVWNHQQFILPAVSLVKSPDLVWARQTRIMRMDLDSTREHEVIHVHDGTTRVVIPPRVSLRKPLSLVKRVSLTRTAPRLVRDELGAWDPSTADWSEPSIYQEVSMESMHTWGRLVPHDDRFAIAASIADRVMCGV